MVPMARFMTIMTPKWMGSMPTLVTTGRKIGVKIIRAGAMSMKVPTKRRIRLMMSRITIRLSDRFRIRELMACGSPVKESTKESTEEAPMISMTMVVMTPDSARTLVRSFREMLR